MATYKPTGMPPGRPPKGGYPEEVVKAAERATVPDICPECFRDGWPPGVYRAGCEHGSYVNPANDPENA